MSDMLFHNKLRSQIVKVLWITFFWTIVSVMQFFLTYSASVQLGLDLSHLDPLEIFQTSIITGFTAGIFGGSTITFFWEKWLRSMSYGWALLNIFWTYSIIYVFVATVGGVFFHSYLLNLPLFNPVVIEAFFAHGVGLNQVASFVFWLGVVLLTLLGLQVNDKYGPGVFVSFLLGKYFQPKREERVFMFLDLRASTQIAEKLGERRYFEFLKELYKDVTPGILQAKGEIYQYVGDEIVVSWKLESGRAYSSCVDCYFNIAQLISDRSGYYQRTYDGILPEFKAGMHAGYAMVGEIGIVKREIAYSGDVLNTTARIQAKCNELGVNLLLSDYLLDKIALPPDYQPRSLGAIELRGKQEAIGLFTIQPNT